MKNASESAVDRLIALALDEVPARPSSGRELDAVPLPSDPGLPAARDLEHNPLWQGLLQLRSFLPVVARALEVSSPTREATTLTAEVRRTVGALEIAHHDLQASITEQTSDLKRMELSVAKTQEATDRNTFELAELGEDVKSVRTLMKVALGVLVFLVLGLAGTVVFLLVRLPHR
ncbi:MAG TPA: hypothetical protein VHX37_00375 [Acidobacteriaceae bacterium]|jgi:hypothetical protein|nr:hypothetical protein [Acidobacteriaceae bacterium]